MYGSRQGHVTRDVIGPSDYDVIAWSGHTSDAAVDGCTLVPWQPAVHGTVTVRRTVRAVAEADSRQVTSIKRITYLLTYVGHKLSSRLPLRFARTAVTFLASELVNKGTTCLGSLSDSRKVGD